MSALRFAPCKPAAPFGLRLSACQLLPLRPRCAAQEEPLLQGGVLTSEGASLSVLTAYIGKYPGSSGRSAGGRASRLERNHLPFSVSWPASAAACSSPARSSCKSGGLSPYETISSSVATAASTNSPQRSGAGASSSGGEAKACLISSGSGADARTS